MTSACSRQLQMRARLLAHKIFNFRSSVEGAAEPALRRERKLPRRRTVLRMVAEATCQIALLARRSAPPACRYLIHLQTLLLMVPPFRADRTRAQRMPANMRR